MLVEMLAGFGLGYIVHDLGGAWRSRLSGPVLPVQPPTGERPAPPIVPPEAAQPVVPATAPTGGVAAVREAADPPPLPAHPFASPPGELAPTGDVLSDPDGEALAQMVARLEVIYQEEGMAVPDKSTLLDHAASLLRGEPVEIQT